MTHMPHYPAPPPPRRNTGLIVGLGCAGATVLVLVASCTAAVVSSSGDDKPTKSAVQADTTRSPKPRPTATSTARPKDTVKTSEADRFKECAAKEGTDAEIEAVSHVTRVTGVDDMNNILDAADVYTDLTGDMFGPAGNSAQLISAVFSACYDSENGLVTVYSKSGEILGNDNF